MKFWKKTFCLMLALCLTVGIVLPARAVTIPRFADFFTSPEPDAEALEPNAAVPGGIMPLFDYEPDLPQDTDGFYLVSSYTELRDVLKNVSAPKASLNLRLSQDISTTTGLRGQSLVLGRAQVVLDLNGHSIRRSTRTSDDVLLTVTDGAGLAITGTGSLSFDREADTPTTLIRVQNGSSLILDGGGYTLEQAAPGSVLLDIRSASADLWDGDLTADGDTVPVWVRSDGNSRSSLILSGGTVETYQPIAAEADGSGSVRLGIFGGSILNLASENAPSVRASGDVFGMVTGGTMRHQFETSGKAQICISEESSSRSVVRNDMRFTELTAAPFMAADLPVLSHSDRSMLAASLEFWDQLQEFQGTSDPKPPIEMPGREISCRRVVGGFHAVGAENAESIRWFASENGSDWGNVLETGPDFQPDPAENSCVRFYRMEADVDGKVYTDTVKISYQFEEKNTLKIQNLTAPVHGKQLDTSAGTDDRNCRVQVSYLLDGEPLNRLPVMGDRLTIVLRLTAGDPAVLTDRTRVVWNGSRFSLKTLADDEKSGVWELEYTVGAEESQMIHTLALSTASPRLGAKPDIPVCDDSRISTDRVVWEPDTDVFRADRPYILTADLTANPGTLFADDILSEGAVTLNGQNMSVTRSDYGHIRVSFTFPSMPCDGGSTCPSRIYKDAPGYWNWAHRGIDFVTERHLFNGLTKDTFGPKEDMSRAMLVTVLWRWAGEPQEGSHSFDDVQTGRYYSKAVPWAAEHKIVTGITKDLFVPDQAVNRQELVTFLYRYAQDQGLDVSAGSCIDAYPDAGKVGGFAKPAMNWAIENHILTGIGINGVNYLQPRESATRAQVAAILQRFAET